jgi:hypothetical protein
MILLSSFLIGIAFFVVLSIVDLLTFNKKKGYIPAVMTTSFMIVGFVIGTINNPLLTLELGALGGLIGLLLSDLDLWGGVADYKVFVAGCLIMQDLYLSLVFGLVLTILGVLVKGIIKWRTKKGKDTQIPFIPIIAVAFAIAGSVL